MYLYIMHDNVYFCDPDQHSNAFNSLFALQLPCDTQGAYDLPVLGWCINFKRHCRCSIVWSLRQTNGIRSITFSSDDYCWPSQEFRTVCLLPSSCATSTVKTKILSREAGTLTCIRDGLMGIRLLSKDYVSSPMRERVKRHIRCKHFGITDKNLDWQRAIFQGYM